MKRSRLSRGTRKFKSPLTRLAGALRMSMTQKKKCGWSREVGAGFIKDDVQDVIPVGKSAVTVHFNWGGVQTMAISDLNLRETEELLKFVLHKQWLSDKPK